MAIIHLRADDVCGGAVGEPGGMPAGRRTDEFQWHLAHELKPRDVGVTHLDSRADATRTLILDDGERGVTGWCVNDANIVGGNPPLCSVQSVGAGYRGKGILVRFAAGNGWATVNFAGARGGRDILMARTWDERGGLAFWARAIDRDAKVMVSLLTRHGTCAARRIMIRAAQWQRIEIPFAKLVTVVGRQLMPARFPSVRLSDVRAIQFLHVGQWSAERFVIDELQVTVLPKRTDALVRSFHMTGDAFRFAFRFKPLNLSAPLHVELFHDVRRGERLIDVTLTSNRVTCAGFTIPAKVRMGKWHTFEIVVDGMKRHAQLLLDGTPLVDSSASRPGFRLTQLAHPVGIVQRYAIEAEHATHGIAEVELGSIQLQCGCLKRSPLESAVGVARQWIQFARDPGLGLFSASAKRTTRGARGRFELVQRYDLLALLFLYQATGDELFRKVVDEHVRSVYEKAFCRGHLMSLAAPRNGKLTNPIRLEAAPNDEVLMREPFASRYVELWKEMLLAYGRRQKPNGEPWCFAPYERTAAWLNPKTLEMGGDKHTELGDSGSRAFRMLYLCHLLSGDAFFKDWFDAQLRTCWRERHPKTGLISGYWQPDGYWNQVDIAMSNLAFFLLCQHDLTEDAFYYAFAKGFTDALLKCGWREVRVRVDGEQRPAGFIASGLRLDGSGGAPPWLFWEWQNGIVCADLARRTGDPRYRAFADKLLTYLEAQWKRMDDKTLLLTAQLAKYLYLETGEPRYWTRFERLVRYFEDTFCGAGWIYTAGYRDNQQNVGNEHTHMWTVGLYVFTKLTEGPWR
ncbi:MAG: hypothetical protein ACTSX8_05865, partial [Alphaproteobacteria bacterium]